MSPIVRRLVARAVLAAGVGAIAILLARACESSAAREVTFIVDPRPLGEPVRAVRIDVFDREGARGSGERRYDAGERPEPLRLETAAPGAGAEVVIEVELADRVDRVRHGIDAPAGSTVKILLGDVTR
ncbi:MAG: hypothetical protein K8M05_18375 [Deltaproteobacteria bacterium]|nr:hypothetical protein [Kofleriaceae bacterium]